MTLLGEEICMDSVGQKAYPSYFALAVLVFIGMIAYLLLVFPASAINCTNDNPIERPWIHGENFCVGDFVHQDFHNINGVIVKIYSDNYYTGGALNDDYTSGYFYRVYDMDVLYNGNTFPINPHNKLEKINFFKKWAGENGLLK